MEITIDKEVLEEIDYVIKHFVEKYKSDVANFATLAFCLQALIKAKEDVESKMKEE